MRKQGLAVVLLGMAALFFIAIDAIRTSVSGVAGQATAGENVRKFPRLIVWAGFVGVVALATLARGLADVMKSRRGRSPADPPVAPNGETAAMIDAEVTEGGPPSPVPCDTPFESRVPEEEHAFMSEEPPPIETCPAPDRIPPRP